MRIAIVNDAWRPQVNGVGQTLTKTRDELEAFVERRSWTASTRQVESYLEPRTRATASAHPASRPLR